VKDEPKKARGPRLPRPPLAAVSPLLVSTRTLAEWTRIPDRNFREVLARHPEIDRSRLGRELLLAPESVRQLLEVLRVVADEKVPRALAEHDTADKVLAAVNLRVVGARSPAR
jgi:hypothetical protein